MKLWKKILLEIAAVLILLAGAILILLSFAEPDHGYQPLGLRLRKDASELSMFLEQYSERYGDYSTEEQGIFALLELPTVQVWKQ